MGASHDGLILRKLHEQVLPLLVAYVIFWPASVKIDPSPVLKVVEEELVHGPRGFIVSSTGRQPLRITMLMRLFDAPIELFKLTSNTRGHGCCCCWLFAGSSPRDRLAGSVYAFCDLLPRADGMELDSLLCGIFSVPEYIGVGSADHMLRAH